MRVARANCAYSNSVEIGSYETSRRKNRQIQPSILRNFLLASTTLQKPYYCRKYGIHKITKEDGTKFKGNLVLKNTVLSKLDFAGAV